MSHLVLIDITVEFAIYWLHPLIKAANTSTLRRIYLRDPNSLNVSAFRLDLAGIDEDLNHRPDVGLVLVFPCPEVIVYYHEGMPMAYSRNAIRILDEYTTLGSPVDDPYGPEYVRSDGTLFVDPYDSDNPMNDIKYEYDPEDDPFDNPGQPVPQVDKMAVLDGHFS
ncbi:hypothetical protein BDQ12DRAFT_671957 [Crucibulum laeve]|uniref:Uncharacterized protein n=1 Tax=Crucibulum laeve TaxID=68775 RepID=A0A5C3LGN2_9AGAR|nr:hypothetical protein BDQ12DRAFT_671957 [Crucibulum laeve]